MNNKNRFSIILVALTSILALITIFSFFFQNDYFYITQREPQTAISSYYMSHEDLGFGDYITPVMGYPWAIPMEFPLYQYMVAQVNNPLISLDDTGRLLGFLFFVLSIWVIYAILGKLNFSPNHKWLLLAFVISSPIYLSYSLSFTIETTALLFSLCYLYLFLHYRQDRKILFLILGVLCGTLASLSKVTTWCVTCGLIVLVIAYETYKNKKAREVNIRDLILKSLFIFIPLIIAYVWVQYSDSIKVQNPLGTLITSSALSNWNYGTLAQKLSIGNWVYFTGRSLIGVFGILGPIIPFYLLYILIRKWKNLDNKLMILAVVITFFSGPVIFTNVYFEHDYYIIAGGIYLIFGFFLISRESIKKSFIILLISCNLLTTFVYLSLKQINYQDPINRDIVKVIKGLPQTYPIIVFGAFFDSFIPYYAQNKALQTLDEDFQSPRFQNSFALMKDKGVGAVIIKSSKFHKIGFQTADALGLEGRFELTQNVFICYKTELAQHFNLIPSKAHQISNQKIDRFLKEFNFRGNRLIVNFNKHNLMSLIFHYSNSIYTFDFKHGLQIFHPRRHMVNKKKVFLKIED